MLEELTSHAKRKLTKIKHDICSLQTSLFWFLNPLNVLKSESVVDVSVSFPCETGLVLRYTGRLSMIDSVVC